MANPYQSHPLYHQRRCLLILAILSFLLSSLAATDRGREVPVWMIHILWTLCSALLCIYDLVRYAMAKAREPESTPDWPSKKIMIGDAFLAAVFGGWYCVELADLTVSYYTSPLAPYASITALCYIFLHTVCFWKAFIALKKAAWREELHQNCTPTQCHHCQQHQAGSPSPEGHTTIEINQSQTPPTPEQNPPRAATTRLTSWLPSMLRRQQADADADDVEASAASPNETTCLITPLTDDDDDDVPPETGAEDENPEEQSIEHLDGSEVLVKKKAKRVAKKNVSDGGSV